MRENVIARARGAAEPLRAHPPAASVGLEPDPQGDAPDLRPRPVHEAGRDDPRARARTARSRPTSSSASPARPRPISARRSRSSTRSATTRAFTFIFSPRRETEAATLPDQVPHAVKRERMERLVELVQRRALERSQRFVGTDAGGAGRGAEPHRPREAARAHAAQQDGQLRRPGAARRAGAGARSRARPRRRSPARSSSCSAHASMSALSRAVRPDRRRQDRGRGRARRPAARARRAAGRRLGGRDPGLRGPRHARRRSRPPTELDAARAPAALVRADRRGRSASAEFAAARARGDRRAARRGRGARSWSAAPGLYLRAALTELDLSRRRPRACASELERELDALGAGRLHARSSRPDARGCDPSQRPQARSCGRSSSSGWASAPHDGPRTSSGRETCGARRRCSGS